MTQATRPRVYEALDTERAYQESLRKKAVAEGNESGPHEIAAYLLYMDDYLQEAKKISARDWSPQCDERTLNVIRKVTALGVACMEAHGAPFRQFVEAVESDLIQHGFPVRG